MSEISQDAKNWALSCLDPYHDYQLGLEGLPDERCAPSVVQMHNQSVSITIPTSAAGGNWDCKVTYTGFNTSIDAASAIEMIRVASAGNHTYASNALATGTRFGSFTVGCSAAGAGFPTGVLNAGDTTLQYGSIKGADRSRLIAVAFEIHNTTAEIYRQGSLTVAQIPDPGEDAGTILYSDSTAAVKSVSAQSDRAPKFCSMLANLQAVPGSQTWPVAKGVYAIPRMTNIPRNVQTFPVGAASSGNGSNGRVAITYGTDNYTATAEPSGYFTDGAVKTPVFQPCVPSGFSPLEVYMSGLSPETTLTLTMRTVVEYFPSCDSTLLPLATPSPGYEPMIFKLYNEVCKQAPYAVPVAQNSAGDYFKKVLGVAGTLASALGPLAGPYAPVVMGAGAAANVLSRPSPRGERVRRDEAGARARPTRKRS